MRSILYSPGFGAGWVSWHHGSEEQLTFMMEYRPFVDAIKARKPGQVTKAASWDSPAVDLAPLLPAFLAEWAAKFPGVDPPYLGGLRDLKVEEVPDGARVRITEYDGSESVEVEGGRDGWL